MSIDYKNQINKVIRNNSLVEINIVSENKEAKNDSKFESNGVISYSSLENLSSNNQINVTYATLELNKWILDGKQEIYNLTSMISQGFISNEISDENGIFNINPMIFKTFSKEFNLNGVSLKFDYENLDIIKSLTVNFYLNNNLINSLINSNIDSNLIFFKTNVTADKVEIIINKVLPFRRARINHVWLGISIVFDNNDIVRVKMKNDVDPLSRRLPIQTLDFSIIDFDRKYDFENPKGIFYLFNLQIETSIRFGYQLDDNSIFWMDRNIFLLNSIPKLENGITTFNCEKILAQLNDIFYKGNFNENKSLSDLIGDISSDANIDNIIFDDVLNNIITSSALPLIKQNFCFQLIAFAAGCSIFCDNNNNIIIKKFDLNNLEIQDFNLDYQTIIDNSMKQSKIPYLEALETLLYSNLIDTNLTETLLNQTIIQTDENERTFSFILSKPATNLNITISTGETFDSQIFSQYVILTLSNTVGEKTITITGNPINYQVNFNRIVPDYNLKIEGEVERISNVLITDETQRQNIENLYLNYYQLRDTFTCEYRGNPELECLDVIKASTFFSNSIKCLVLVNEIIFDGSLYGTVKVKKISDMDSSKEEWFTKEVQSDEIMV